MSETKDEILIFTEAPMVRDPRQGALASAIPMINEKLSKEGYNKTGFINCVGWPACHVNLGWIDDKIEKYWKNEQPEIDWFVKQIHKELPQVISRLKRRTLNVEHKSNYILINSIIVTKDDSGYYEYRFSTILRREGK